MITKEQVEEGREYFFASPFKGAPYNQGSVETLFSWLTDEDIQIVKDVLGDRCFTVPVSDWTDMDNRAMNVISWLTHFE